MVTASTSSAKKVFVREDGVPYEFWIQSDLNEELKTKLESDIKKHGGKVITEKKKFPSHGFLLIQAMNPAPLYNIQTAFHRPAQADPVPFSHPRGGKPNPHRHVVSTHFVKTAIEAANTKGDWDSTDIRRWSHPVILSEADSKDLKATLRRVREEVRQGVDPRLEEAWIWRKSKVFDSYDERYDFSAEFDALDKELEPNQDQPNFPYVREWSRGAFVAARRLKWQLKFHLYRIDDEKEAALIRSIMENGGAVCYTSTEADVILVGCDPHEAKDDIQIEQWINQARPREDPKRLARTLFKFSAWVDDCIGAGDWNEVEKTSNDVKASNRALEKQEREERKAAAAKSNAKAKTGSGLDRKRKIPSPGEEDSDGFEILGDPPKRQKLQHGEASISRPFRKISAATATHPSTAKKGNRSIIEPGSASTVKPTRVLSAGMASRAEPSPLKHNLDAAPLSFPNGRSSKGVAQAKEQEPPMFETFNDYTQPSFMHGKPRVSAVSAASAKTADTATSSKVGNTTTNTTTTGTSKSARSVGPSHPNAKQVGRPSTSTGTGTEPSFPSRANSSYASPRKSNQSRPSTFSNEVDADDLAGEAILEGFPTEDIDQIDEIIKHPSSSSSPHVVSQLDERERAIIKWHRSMVKLNYEEGLETVEAFLKDWPEKEKELEEAAKAHRRRKGKGRVSFHEPEEEDVEPTAEEVVSDPEDVPEEPPVPPIAHQRYATPDSVKGSDESSSNSESEEEKSDEEPSPRRMETRSRTSHSPGTSRRLRSGRTVSSHPEEIRSIKPVSKESRPTEKDAEPATAPEESSAPTDEDKLFVPDSEEEMDELEDDVAPLPDSPIATQSRSRRKGRSGVLSGDESAAEEAPLRRGRSASIAPSDISMTRKGGARPRRESAAPRGVQGTRRAKAAASGKK